MEITMDHDNPTILFIDDEPNVLDALRRKLREYDKHWTMIFSHSCVEALEIIGKRAVDVVVTDQTMPKITGLECKRRPVRVLPDVGAGVIFPFTRARARWRDRGRWIRQFAPGWSDQAGCGLPSFFQFQGSNWSS